MSNKVILISIDGMRPDAVISCGNPFVEELFKISSYSMTSRTVFPSVTLPCHMSLFHSVEPTRHGTTTNVYTPQVRPINGLVEQIKILNKTSFAYMGWEQMRDISRPGSFQRSFYININTISNCDDILTQKAIEDAKSAHPDFIYLYLGDTDEIGGHKYGWMSKEYLGFVSTALSNVKKVVDELGDEYTIIVTADHGGHDRCHGTELPEDMTIPMFFIGEEFNKGEELTGVSILDLAPTIATIMQVPFAPEWEGKVLIKK